MTLLRSIFICEIILLLSWMIIEGVYTSSLIGSLVAILALILLTIFIPLQTKSVNHRIKTLLIIADVVAISFFVMELAYVINEGESLAKLPLSYNKLKYVSYFSFYLSIICLFFGIIALLVSGLFKRKQHS